MRILTVLFILSDSQNRHEAVICKCVVVVYTLPGLIDLKNAGI